MSDFKEEKPLIILLDASNLIYRAYHAMESQGRKFSAPDGTPTGGISTYLNMIQSIRKKYPDAVFVAMHEHPGGSFRDSLSESYKQNRPKTPDELKIQLALAQSLTPLLGIPALSVETFEADDLLCAYSVLAEKNGWNVIMVTSDKDMHQVVSENVHIIDPNYKDKIFTPEGTKERFGVYPNLIVQYLSLMGDAIDGVAGVPGIGKKKAADLLNKYGSVEAVFEASHSFSPAMKKAFETYPKEQMDLAIKLTTGCLDMPLPMSLEQLSAHRPDWEAALPELKRLAFKGYIARAEKEIQTQMKLKF